MDFWWDQIGSGEIHWRKKANKIEPCFLNVLWIIFPLFHCLPTVWRQRLCCNATVVPLLTWRVQ